MADEFTLNDSEVTVWADKDHPRKVMGRVKVNGKQLKTAKTSVTVTETATVEGKGKVTLTWVQKPAKKSAPKKAPAKKAKAKK